MQVRIRDRGPKSRPSAAPPFSACSSAPPARANSRDRFGRRFIYQFNLLLFGVFTILGAFAPSVTLLVICRFIAGIGLGAEQPLAFAYAGEYSPKRIRGRILAIVHFIGGACVWPIGTGRVVLRCLRHAMRDDARIRLARRVARHRHRRADRLGVPLHAAGIAALSGDARPRQGSARRARQARHCRADASRCRPMPPATPRAIRSASCSACSRSASSPA